MKPTKLRPSQGGKMWGPTGDGRRLLRRIVETAGGLSRGVDALRRLRAEGEAVSTCPGCGYHVCSCPPRETMTLRVDDAVLPPGLSRDPETGVIGGTPTGEAPPAGPYSIASGPLPDSFTMDPKTGVLRIQGTPEPAPFAVGDRLRVMDGPRVCIDPGVYEVEQVEYRGSCWRAHLRGQTVIVFDQEMRPGVVERVEPEPTFKVGDRVRHRGGEEGTIVEGPANSGAPLDAVWWTHTFGTVWLLRKDAAELLTVIEPEPPYKVGDLVEVDVAEDGCWVMATVTAVSAEGIVYARVGDGLEYGTRPEDMAFIRPRAEPDPDCDPTCWGPGDVVRGVSGVHVLTERHGDGWRSRLYTARAEMGSGVADAHVGTAGVRRIRKAGEFRVGDLVQAPPCVIEPHTGVVEDLTDPWDDECLAVRDDDGDLRAWEPTLVTLLRPVEATETP